MDDDPTYDEMRDFLVYEKKAPTGVMGFVNEAIWHFTKKHGEGKPNMMDAHVRCGYDPGSFVAIMSSESPASLCFDWLEERFATAREDKIGKLLTGVSGLPEDKDLYDKPERTEP